MKEIERYPRQKEGIPYEEGFLLVLLLLAVGGLVWLFLPFLPSLFLAVLLAASSYPIMRHIQERFGLEIQVAALVMTLLVLFLVITPMGYLLVETGLRAGTAYQEAIAMVTQTQGGKLAAIEGKVLSSLPISEDTASVLMEQLKSNQSQLMSGVKKVLLFVLNSVYGNTLSFFSTLFLIVFALFFFYRDGPELLYRVKVLSPLDNRYDRFIMSRFTAMATVLTLSTVGIALLQGVIFSVVAMALELPWLYLGVAIAVTSFIPVVGALIIWAPLTYFLYLDERYIAAVVVVIFGGVIIGFVVDNLVRPVLIRWLSGLQSDQVGGIVDALSHTLLTVLSTFGGLLSFGILGLFFGPMIAAMAITIFDVYELKYAQSLDHS